MPQHDLVLIGDDTIQIDVHTTPLKKHRTRLESVVIDQSVNMEGCSKKVTFTFELMLP